MNLKRLLAISAVFISSYISTAIHQHNALLLINYNVAHYVSIPLLKKMYEPYFKKVVFYGPEEHPEVHLCKHYYGYFSYTAIADAMQRYPDYDGYFFLMDDVILNAWRLQQHDPKKIWYPDYAWIKDLQGDHIDLTKGLAATTWSWWERQWGYAPTLKAYNELPTHYRKVLAANRGENHVVVANSDIAYIPAQYKEQFIELAHIFAQHSVFLEIALPTIVSCLSPKSEWTWLHGRGAGPCFTKDYPNSNQYFVSYVDFLHPIKLSFVSNREAIEKIFDEALAKITNNEPI